MWGLEECFYAEELEYPVLSVKKKSLIFLFFFKFFNLILFFEAGSVSP